MTRNTDPAPVLAILEEAGIEAAYRQWAPADPPPLPYAVFFRCGRDDLYADDTNYFELAHWCVRLYTDGPDFESMAAVEAALKAHGIAYACEETDSSDLGVPLGAVYYFDMLGAR